MSTINILLADDDIDDCIFFKEALEELQLDTNFTNVHNGEQLMKLLQKSTSELPDILFLDLNMPRKNGLSCLTEIKHNKRLKQLPVIIFSTSFDENIADLLFKHGAQYYICKPADFALLKKVIHQALILTKETNSQPTRENFLLNNFKTILR